MNVRVKTPKNFPVDLYYLMDLSATMKASLKEIRNLGSRLSEYCIVILIPLFRFLVLTHSRVCSLRHCNRPSPKDARRQLIFDINESI